jgi:small subunit ribosomal protein S8
MTDPIADMLTRVRNANLARLRVCSMPSSKVKVEIARLLGEGGFIKGYDVVEDDGKKVLKITMKYGPKGARLIKGLKRVSKPGFRRYAGKDDIPPVWGADGIVIVSTSKGLLTGRQAREAGTGGEVLCYVW